MEVCPTEVIHASAERIWLPLMDPRELAHWSETKLISGPARPARAGDRFVLGAGLMRARFELLEAEPPERVRFFVQLPFGIVNHEQIQITPTGADSCRVTFN